MAITITITDAEVTSTLTRHRTERRVRPRDDSAAGAGTIYELLSSTALISSG